MSSPNIPFDIGITISGDANCPKYSAAYSNGMTVVAESQPPLMLAAVLSAAPDGHGGSACGYTPCLYPQQP